MYNFKELYTLDFSTIKYCSEIHSIIKKELDFPDYYGCNWDAFWDCLTDMAGRPVNIRILGIENVEKKFKDSAEIMLEILKDFKHYRNNKYSDQINIEIVRDEKSIKL